MILSSARQSSARGLASWAQALPAESSRQALLRSVGPSLPSLPPSPAPIGVRRAHGKATYSAAAAVQTRDERFDRYDPHYPLHSMLERMERSDHAPDPRPPDPASYQPILTRLEIFRALHTSRPFDALRMLTQLDHGNVSRIAVGEINALMAAIRKTVFEMRGVLEEMDEDMVEHGLQVIRDYLHDHPVSIPGSSDIYPPGHRLRTRHLTAFLLTCLATRQVRLLRSTFRERAKVQEETGDPLIVPYDFVVKLSSARLWHLLLTLFDPNRYSFKYYTPFLLERYILAHLATMQLEAIPRLFAQHEALGLTPTAESYAHLTQAYLRLGDFESARETTHRAEREGRYDTAAQQMALLRGHKALGQNLELEANVLADLESLGREPDAALLNAIIRLRHQAGDHPGVVSLLRRFQLHEFGGAEGKVKPNAETRILAFSVSAYYADLAGLQTAWRGLVYRGEAITDRYFSTLINALSRLKEPELALNIVNRAFEGTYSPDWPVPESFRPETRSLNTLLGSVSRKEGVPGLSKVLKLFGKYHVPLDNQTTTMILEFAKQDTEYSPAQLALLATKLASSSPHLKATVAQLDLLLSHAIRTAGRSKPGSAVSKQSAEAFHFAMRPILQSLRARSIKLPATSLRNRLRFDAYASAQRKSIPGARETWIGLVARGLQPTREHLVALMQGYADAGAMDECADALALANELKLRETSEMYMTLIVGWGRVRNFAKAADAYRGWLSLQRRGRTDLVAASAIVHAALRSGKYSIAAALVKSEMAYFQMDKISAAIAVRAYQHTHEYAGALDIVAAVGPALSTELRRAIRQIRQYTSRHGPSEIPDRCLALLQLDDRARPRQMRRYTAKRTTRKVVYMLRKPGKRRLRGVSRRWSHRTRSRRHAERAASARQAGPEPVAAQFDTAQQKAHEVAEVWSHPEYLPVLPRA